MSDFQRYAVYYVPDAPDLAAFGAAWLGWDVVAGEAVAQLPVPGLVEATEAPRKYGFHGTLKPPFRLAKGCSLEGLQGAVAAFAGRTAPVVLDGLRIARIGRFLALVPEGDVAGLEHLAFDCVREFDGYRAVAGESELARRRGVGLTARQEALLARWGYPYVAEEFRFHLTLTGALGPDDLARMAAAAKAHVPELSKPFEMRSIALVGEDRRGRFHLVHRYPLSG